MAYIVGLTNHGLTNWQEAQRALVFREMLFRGDWLLPTQDGQAYLAKPPLVYWCQLAVAGVTWRNDELPLRLTVALAGLAGIISTYLVGRGILRDARDDAEWADRAAFWGAAMLGTGILYVRSSRIGEIDILLAPLTVVSIGAIHAAWRRYDQARRTHWAAVSIAVVMASLAALAKGPPALLTIMLGGYGAVLVHVARSRDGPILPWRLRCLACIVGACVPAALAVHLNWGAINFRGGLGIVVFAAIGAGTGWLIARLASPKKAWRAVRVFAHTHPVLVLGAPILPLWLWSRAVRARAAPGVIEKAIAAEAEDNLRWFTPESPIVNLEASLYGVGIASVLAIAAVVWLVRDRPRLGRGGCVVIAWVVLSLAAFSVLGKGVPRYLTPVWPGIALLAGMWFAWATRDSRFGTFATRAMGAMVIILAAVQGAWYGYGREWMYASRSPRALVGELLEADLDPRRLAALDFRSPALDFYAGRVVTVVESSPGAAGSGLGPLDPVPLSGFVQRLRDGQGEWWLVLAREGSIEPLALAGLAVQTIPTGASFKIDSGRSEIVVLRVSAHP